MRSESTPTSGAAAEPSEQAQPMWVPHPDLEALGRTEASRFEEVFGSRPAGVWMSPGRANLNGEHIDFLGGRCLPLALPYGTVIAAAARTDGMLRMRTLEPSLDEGVVEVPVSQIGPGSPTGWTGYVAGALWGLMRLDPSTFPVPQGFGADLLIRSTLPMGGGLSSSAALECAAILAFVGLASGRIELDDAERTQLAHAAMMAEVEVVGAATGGLDQTASLRAQLGKVLSLDCRDFTVEHFDASPLLAGHRLVAVDTNTPHWLGGQEFSSRRADAEAAGEFLGAARMRDLLPEHPNDDDAAAVLQRFAQAAPTAQRLDGRDPEDAAKRLAHAMTEMVRSEKIDALLRGDLPRDIAPAQALGRILTDGHASMRDNAEASFEVADAVVEAGVAAGAAGARLIGGGFGGSVLVLMPLDRVGEIASAIDQRVRGLGAQPPRFMCIEPSRSGRRICRDCL